MLCAGDKVPHRLHNPNNIASASTYTHACAHPGHSQPTITHLTLSCRYCFSSKWSQMILIKQPYNVIVNVIKQPYNMILIQQPQTTIPCLSPACSAQGCVTS